MSPGWNLTKDQAGCVLKTSLISPVPAEESLRWLHAEPGYRVRLVAAEPQVVDPVAMQIDEEHRMWVVEMRDYPMGDPEQGLGRIVVLQDEDRDGRYERATTFASGLRFPTGIQLWKGGAFVTAAGELLYLKDENRDLIADSQETVLKGFSIGNPQLRANHPTIGMDGWLYVANGLKGGKVDLPSSHPSSEAIDMTNRDLRLHLKEGRVEAITGPSQFGLSMDAWGHRYGCSNRRPCIEMMVEQSDIRVALSRAWFPQSSIRSQPKPNRAFVRSSMHGPRRIYMPASSRRPVECWCLIVVTSHPALMGMPSPASRRGASCNVAPYNDLGGKRWLRTSHHNASGLQARTLGFGQ